MSFRVWFSPSIALALMSAISACAAPIGPDAFGYTATSAQFDFRDISGSGSRILSDNDDDAVNVGIGFGFGFYGRIFSDLYVSSNGLISFESPNSIAIPQDLTFFGPQQNVPTIAVLWDDWTTLKSAYPSSDAVYVQTLGSPGSRTLVVQWNRTYGCCPLGTEPLSFQAILHEASGDILFQYYQVLSGVGIQQFPGDNGDSGSTAGIGIRDTDGEVNGRNLQWSYAPGTTAIQNGEAIRFSASSQIPEPSYFVLLGVGLSILAASRKRSLWK